MKHIILLLVSMCLAPCMSLNAQDLIAQRDGSVIEAKIIEVGQDHVKYRLYGDTGGPVYNMDKSDILMIRYESTGHVEDFSGKMPIAAVQQETEVNRKLSPYLRYRQLKTIYDYRDYSPYFTDRYSTGGIGVASFFIPGLGECICGEWGRGLGKFFTCGALSAAGTIFVMRSYVDYNWRTDIVLAIISYAAVIGIDVWSIVDAVRMSKVKNMYYNDLYKQYSMDIDLYPSQNHIQIGDRMYPMAGLTLALKF